MLVWPRAPSPGSTILLHGFTGRADSWSPVVHELRRLRDRSRLVAVDLPGHHPGLPVDRRGGFDGAVDRLATLLEHLGLGRVSVVGYSMGARLALGLAARHPRRVRAAVLIGVHPGLSDERERLARRQIEDAWIECLRIEGVGKFMEAWESMPLFETQAGCAAETLGRQSALRRSHDARTLAHALELLGLSGMPDRWPALSSLPMQVTFLVGSLDEKFRRLAERGARLAPRGKLVVIAGCGHNAVLEAPGQLARCLAEELKDD
jgi:2-succinyl-6-hydroxy-2,4-cyclohexadiene-1-carboxylate synthase